MPFNYQISMIRKGLVHKYYDNWDGQLLDFNSTYPRVLLQVNKNHVKFHHLSHKMYGHCGRVNAFPKCSYDSSIYSLSIFPTTLRYDSQVLCHNDFSSFSKLVLRCFLHSNIMFVFQISLDMSIKKSIPTFLTHLQTSI